MDDQRISSSLLLLLLILPLVCSSDPSSPVDDSESSVPVPHHQTHELVSHVVSSNQSCTESSVTEGTTTYPLDSTHAETQQNHEPDHEQNDASKVTTSGPQEEFVEEVIVQAGKPVVDGTRIAPESSEATPEPVVDVVPVSVATTDNLGPTSESSVQQKISSNLSSSQLDNLCLERALKRAIINEQDIKTVINRVTGAFERFSRVIQEIGSSSSSPDTKRILGPDATTQPETTATSAPPDGDSEAEVIVEVIAMNNKTLTSGEDLKRIQAELEEVSRQVLRGSSRMKESGEESDDQEIKRPSSGNPLEGFEKFGDVLAKAITSFGELVRTVVYPEVQRLRGRKGQTSKS